MPHGTCRWKLSIYRLSHCNLKLRRACRLIGGEEPQMSRRGIPFSMQVAIASGAGALGLLAVAQTDLSLSDVATFFSSGGHVTCPIKGNISINTGERIYHVPGQEYYDETIISPQYGERWFCSEAEARAAGWRKARR